MGAVFKFCNAKIRAFFTNLLIPCLMQYNACVNSPPRNL